MPRPKRRQSFYAVGAFRLLRADDGDWPPAGRHFAIREIDPHHFTPVRRGSARDLELRETYPRWKDWAQVEVYG